MNKFAKWMRAHHKKQRGVAETLGISPTNLHDILKKNQMPSLKTAYKIEKYTDHEITLYDWIDEENEMQDLHDAKKKK